MTSVTRAKILEALEKEIPDRDDNVRINKISDLHKLFQVELYQYFCATQMARATRRFDENSMVASKHLFAYRVKLENAIIKFLKSNIISQNEILSLGLKKPFSCSKKQGISFRLPLNTCMPSPLCGNLCYAHDGLDAMPGAVVKGCLNLTMVSLWDRSRIEIGKRLDPVLNKVISVALKEASVSQFSRRARIRFAHVGEMAAVPDFSNYIANRIHELSNGLVDCVVYTRHNNAYLLDFSKWIINFTIDNASNDRLKWAPPSARIVASSFGGKLERKAEINFLEHHREFHHDRDSSHGNVCPATLPKVSDRTCDGNYCDRCFKKT